MEPAAMLIRAFQIQVGGEAAFGPALHHSGETGARVEPDVKDVGFPAPARAAAVRAGQPGGHEVLGGGLEPVVAACGVLGETLGHFHAPGVIVPGGAAAFAQQSHDGNAPGALARDAPVRPVLNHGEDALLAPGGNPAHILADGLKGALAQVVGFHGDEPLGGGAEDDRLFAAPAVGIRVADAVLNDQVVHFHELFNDQGVGFKDGFSSKELHAVQEAAAVIQGGEYIQTVFQPHFVVFAAVAGRGVHGSGAGVQGDVAAKHHRGRAIVKRMLGDQSGKAFAFDMADDHGVFPAKGGAADFQALFGQDVAVALHLNENVVKVRVHGHGHVVGQGPGRGGPDDQPGAAFHSIGKNFVQVSVRYRKAHVDGRRGVVVVLHLGLGQSGMARAAPVDGLFAARHIPGGHEVAQFPG